MIVIIVIDREHVKCSDTLHINKITTNYCSVKAQELECQSWCCSRRAKWLKLVNLSNELEEDKVEEEDEKEGRNGQEEDEDTMDSPAVPEVIFRSAASI